MWCGHEVPDGNISSVLLPCFGLHETVALKGTKAETDTHIMMMKYFPRTQLTDMIDPCQIRILNKLGRDRCLQSACLVYPIDRYATAETCFLK